MVKAVFIDYMGTTVDEHSPEMAEIVRRVCKNSSLHDPKQVQRFSLNIRRRYEANFYLDTYLTQDEIVDRLISDMADKIGLTDEPSALRGLIRSHWVNASVFPDARVFFDRCPVPLYIIINIGFSYMEQALRNNGLMAMGVVSADSAQAYKPRREIFDEALRVSGCTPDEVIHIVDSYDTDVAGARSEGVSPLLFLRGQRQQYNDGADTANDLEDALELINAEPFHK